jgi:hypothetical protein
MGRRPRDLPVAGLVLPVSAGPLAILVHLRPCAGGLDPALAVVDAHQRVQPARVGDGVRQRMHADRQARPTHPPPWFDKSAIVVEPDAVAADCFDARRARLLRRSVKRLADAGHHVYLDAGHARWRSTGETAQRLLVAGIQYAQGFAVNVANRQTTRESYRWGRELSDLVGHREFVIDTSRNGLGPPRMSPTGTTSGATRVARVWARPPQPGRPYRGWPRCSGSSLPASRTASAEARPPISSPRPRHDA